MVRLRPIFKTDMEDAGYCKMCVKRPKGCKECLENINRNLGGKIVND